MWKPSKIVYKHYRNIDKSLLSQFPECLVSSSRNVNDGRIESRYMKSKSGWFSRKGTRPGYPASWPDSRVIGVDLNLQERLDQIYCDQRQAERSRKDIGLAHVNKETPATNRSRMMEYRKKQRADPNLERAARKNELEIDVDDVKVEHLASGGLFNDIVFAADLYGIYEDLFGADMMFRPCKDIQIQYDFDDEYVTPVFRGNVIKPKEAESTPTIRFDTAAEEDCYWTLVMSNPDGHFTEDNSEYLHWMVGNIPSTNSMESKDNDNACNIDLASMGETVCPYLQPFPSYGTGFHRFVFILYKHKNKLDLSEYKQPAVEEGVDLLKRTFLTREFHDKFETHEGGSLNPVALGFFQADYDLSLNKFYHNILNMEEPKYEYNFLPPYVRPWNDLFKDHFANQSGFNNFLDKYRDPKEIQEEILKKRLKSLDPFKGDLDREIKYPNAHAPHPDQKEAKGRPHEMLELGPMWRLREIERERLRIGLYKDMDWFEPRRDPCN